MNTPPITTVVGGLVIQHYPEVSVQVAAVPQSITRAQGKAALIQAGMWDQTLAFVAAIPDPTERALAEVALHDTQTWQRNSPFLIAAAAALGLSDAQMDDLFIAARAIEF